MLEQIMTRLLTQLVSSDKLLLVEGASIQNLVQDILSAMPNAGFGAHFGSWLSATLINHNSVDELFASDEELTEMLRYIN